MFTILKIPGLITLGIFVFRLGRYLSTPFLRKIGFYKYYSPMFCTMPFFNNHLDIHLGTSWDFFKLRKLNPRIIMLYLAEGLFNLGKAIEQGKIDPDKTLRGNVFYLNTTTFEKFGFKSRRLNSLEFVLFLMNYVELCILQSISSGKLSIVSFKNLSILTCRAGELPRHSKKLEGVIKHLRKERTAEVKTKEVVVSQPQTELVFND